jgi:hypothetical protein
MEHASFCAGKPEINGLHLALFQLTKKLTMLSYSYYYDFQENDMGRDYGVTAAPQPKHTFFDNKSNKPKHTFWKECSVCFELMKDDAFASFNQYCSHDGTICTNCIKTYVRSAVSGPDVNVKCPECSIFYSSDTVSNLLNAGDREKYHFKLATTMLSSDPNFVWCAHGCGSGQIEENTDSKIKCVNCSKHTCSKHQVPWHRGYSCEAYEFSRSVRDRKTIKYLADNCKRCPSCSWAIERSMYCSPPISNNY